MFPICKNQGGGGTFLVSRGFNDENGGDSPDRSPRGHAETMNSQNTEGDHPEDDRFSMRLVVFWGRILRQNCFFSERCRLYTPEEFNMEHENDGFQEGISFSRGLFSGSMLNTWDVSVLSNSGWWSFQIV